MVARPSRPVLRERATFGQATSYSYRLERTGAAREGCALLQGLAGRSRHAHRSTVTAGAILSSGER